LLALVSISHFEKLVQEHKSAYKSKELRSWTQFVAMLFGQLSGQHGLRSIETRMNSQRNRFYHLGIDEHTEVNRSTVSYANSNRSSDLYKSLFETTLEKAQQKSASHGFRFKNPLYSVDSTSIDLCLKLFPWADFQEKKGGIKLTVKLDHRGKIPCFVTESNVLEHDCKKIRLVPFAANDVVVFDCGYADYSLTGQKVWFVTRLKKNTGFKRVKRNESLGKDMVSDYEIIIRDYSKGKHLREIIVRYPDTGKKITLLTNNLKWSVSTVSAVNRGLWQIGLFFKAIKKKLKIERFTEIRRMW
jgi:hypothetical protein